MSGTLRDATPTHFWLVLSSPRTSAVAGTWSKRINDHLRWDGTAAHSQSAKRSSWVSLSFRAHGAALWLDWTPSNMADILERDRVAFHRVVDHRAFAVR